MTKKELRKLYLEKRSQLTSKDLVRLDSLLLIKFQQLGFGDINSVLSFWPMEEKSEVNTHLFADYLSFKIPGLQLAFPVMEVETLTMRPVMVDDATVYAPNRFGIIEPIDGEEFLPAELDIVFVPLLAFDTNGYRVGYGKGFYDRFLPFCSTDILKIGFSYFEAEAPVSDINEFDVPLNICITPNKIYEF